ncbi:acyltransferase family protein [uncultured Oscillibacter sp.]|uniref:acyltransferase family protein n=1 Tax=uncultured Oscillibacter sp. TaxID=876091 RepID=UPI0025E05869|nr:acyltransferase family protein [uncultured Oscillibacter sp.]
MGESIQGTPRTSRIEYIDIARGLAILLVVIGHNLENSMLGFKVIYSFHVPAFFFLSGIVFRPEKYKSGIEIIKDKAKRLLHPYFLFGFITMMVYCTFRESSINALKCLLFANRYQMMEVPFNVPMWFIPCLFLVLIEFYWIQKYIPQKLSFVIFLGCSLLGYRTITQPILPWTLDSSLYYLLFFSLGHFSKKYIDLCKHKYCILLSFIVFLSQFILYTNVQIPYLLKYLIETVCAMSGTVLLVAFSQYILFSKIFAAILKRPLEYLGNNSLLILILHTPIRDWIVGILIWGISGQFYCGYGIRSINVILSLLICIPFIEAINKFFPSMLGKQQVEQRMDKEIK